jgi:plasmid maintenance system antidote protein VapI
MTTPGAEELDNTPTAADLRAQVARDRALLYLIAAKIPLHPTKLGQLLNGRAPLTPAMARRIREALG